MSARRDPHMPKFNHVLVAVIGLPVAILLIMAVLMASQSAPNWENPVGAEPEAPPEWGAEEQISISVGDRENPRGVRTETSDKIDRVFTESLLKAMDDEHAPADTADRLHAVVETGASKHVVQVNYTNEHLYIDDAKQHYGLAELEHDPVENSCFYRNTEGTLGTSLCGHVPLEDDGPVAQGIKDAIVEKSEHLEEWDPNLWPGGTFEYLRIEDLEEEPKESAPAQ